MSARYLLLLLCVIVLSWVRVTPVSADPAMQVDLASQSAWTFKPDGDGTVPKPLPVPAGGWTLNGFPKAHSGVYDRQIRIPKLPGGGAQTTLLAFEAVNWEAVVSVGLDAAHLHEAGRHLSAWTPFRIDISPFVTPGRTADVQVRVRDRDSFKNGDGQFTVPASVEWNDRQARGIIRGVSLQVYPVVYISDVFVRPDTASNTLSYQVALTNASDRPRSVTLSGRLTPWNLGVKWDYPRIAPQQISVAPRTTRIVTVGPLRWTPGRASWWWPNVPYRVGYHAQLHNLTLTLQERSASATTPDLQREVTRFGFCTPGQKGNSYTLNGVRINLRGDSLPEGTIGTDAFARLPGFLRPSERNGGWPQAVRNYQQLNYNVVRMHQIPCTRTMMDVCDEEGLLVIPETAIRGGGGKKEDITALPETFLTHLRELIMRDRNHPSVFKWSLENELFGAPEAFIRKLYDTCMEADGTRPCSIDDNADYPSWPRFAVIEHYSQSPGDPDPQGGKPRSDRPYGQGEYVWPMGNTPAGAYWFGLETRALRAHDNADIRPYTLIDVWPGVIPGLTPANFPNPHLPPDSLEQGGRSLLDPAEPWDHPVIQLLQRSFAPVAAFDPDYDSRMNPGSDQSASVIHPPTLSAGRATIRRLTVFNDDFTGSALKVSIAPVLRIEAGKPQKLPILTQLLTIQPGEHQVVAFDVPVPDVPHNSVMQLMVHVQKGGLERYTETETFLVIPPGTAGTEAEFVERDDKTQGNWLGVYGKEGFLVPIHAGTAGFSQESVRIRRGTGEKPSGHASNPLTDTPSLSDLVSEQNGLLLLDPPNSADVTDPRVPLGNMGLKARTPIGLAAGSSVVTDPKTGRERQVQMPLILRIDTTDARPHLVSFYLLDYKRAGLKMQIEIYDLYGNPLESRYAGDFGDGAYIRYRVTGSILALFRLQGQAFTTLSGVFVDPG